MTPLSPERKRAKPSDACRYARWMSKSLEKGKYLLGDAERELQRLGRQHEIWRDRVEDGWRKAGICPGSRVLDVGAGPGFATADLAALVGARGTVTAVERSGEFVEVLRARFAAESARIQIAQVDLMLDAIPIDRGLHDAAWCRWVAMFVPDIDRLVGRIATALRPGGGVVFHEYACYRTYALMPRRTEIEEFLDHAIAALAQCGGIVDAAGSVLAALGRHGFSVERLRLLPSIGRPGEGQWEWPAEFIRVFAPRIVALGLGDDAWLTRLLAVVDEAERDGTSAFVGPLNCEIIARLDREPT